MKKIILSICLCWVAGQVSAQNSSKSGSPDATIVHSQKADNFTRQLAQDLQLNEHQYIKVKAIHQDRLKQLKDIEVKYSNNPAKRDESIKILDADTDKQLAHVLNPNQLHSYLELQGRGQEQIADLQDNYLAVEEEQTEIQEMKQTTQAKPALPKPHNTHSERERVIEQRSYEYEE